MSASNLSVNRFTSYAGRYPKQLFIGLILIIALIAFEIFNFDTTQFALVNLLGDVAFAGLAWATILAIAFCGIDLAGLVRLFTPQQGGEEPKEVWYLMGAWILGATMNAVMTWWAVSLTLLNNDFGNEVLSREQLLRYVPIFVAILVWLTRILFIGSISIAGEHLMGQGGPAQSSSPAQKQRLLGRNKYKSSGSAVSKGAPAPKQTAPPPRSAAPPQPKPASPPPPRNYPSQPSYQGTNAARPPSKPPVARQPAIPVAAPPTPPPASSISPPPNRKPLNSPVTPVNKPNGRVRQRPPRPGMNPTSVNAGPQINS